MVEGGRPRSWMLFILALYGARIIHIHTHGHARWKVSPFYRPANNTASFPSAPSEQLEENQRGEQGRRDKPWRSCWQLGSHSAGKKNTLYYLKITIKSSCGATNHCRPLETSGVEVSLGKGEAVIFYMWETEVLGWRRRTWSLWSSEKFSSSRVAAKSHRLVSENDEALGKMIHFVSQMSSHWLKMFSLQKMVTTPDLLMDLPTEPLTDQLESY